MKIKNMSDELYNYWKKNKGILLTELIEFMNCSGATVHRRLKDWNASSSFNMNGRYYSLPEFIEFDNNGLCFFGDVGFSKYNTLAQTILHLITSSKAGLCNSDIKDLLHFKFPSSSLIKVSKKVGLFRRKFCGNYFYFALDKKIYSIQIQERKEIAKWDSTKKLSLSTAIEVLAELINNPKSNPEEISNSLMKRCIKATPGQIKNFFESHDLLKKTLEFAL